MINNKIDSYKLKVWNNKLDNYFTESLVDICRHPGERKTALTEIVERCREKIMPNLTGDKYKNLSRKCQVYEALGQMHEGKNISSEQFCKLVAYEKFQSAACLEIAFRNPPNCMLEPGLIVKKASQINVKLDFLVQLIELFNFKIPSIDSSAIVEYFSRHNSFYQEHEKILNSLIKVAPELLAAKDAYGNGMLHCLLAGQSYDFLRHSIVEQLINNKLSSAQDRNHAGETPLHIVMRCGYIAHAKLLLARGADLIVTDHCGKTPLDLAFEANLRPMLTKLYDYVYGLGLVCEEVSAAFGTSSLSHLILTGRTKEALESGKQFKNKILEKDSLGRTPLYYACLVGDNDFISNVQEICDPRLFAECLPDFFKTGGDVLSEELIQVLAKRLCDVESSFKIFKYQNHTRLVIRNYTHLQERLCRAIPQHHAFVTVLRESAIDAIAHVIFSFHSRYNVHWIGNNINKTPLEQATFPMNQGLEGIMGEEAVFSQDVNKFLYTQGLATCMGVVLYHPTLPGAGIAHLWAGSYTEIKILNNMIGKSKQLICGNVTELKAIVFGGDINWRLFNKVQKHCASEGIEIGESFVGDVEARPSNIFLHLKEKKLYALAKETKSDSHFALVDAYDGQEGFAWHVSSAKLQEAWNKLKSL